MSTTVTLSPTLAKDVPCATLSTRSKAEREGDSEDPIYGRVTETIIFHDCPTGLGIKIIGGASDGDDEKDFGIFIKKVLFGGLASVDGRLHAGDEILEVNGDSLSQLTNEEAVHLLRKAAASNYFKFVVTRDDKAKSDFEDCLENHAAGSCDSSSAADQVSLCSQSSSTSLKGSQNWLGFSPGGNKTGGTEDSLRGGTHLSGTEDSLRGGSHLSGTEDSLRGGTHLSGTEDSLRGGTHLSGSSTPPQTQLFHRKLNKEFRGAACPLHCANRASCSAKFLELVRSGTQDLLQFPGERLWDESDLDISDSYTAHAACSPPTFSEIDACVSAVCAASLPTPIPTPHAASDTPLPKVSNATAAAFPLQHGPHLRPSLASTPQGGTTAGFLTSHTSTPQTAEWLDLSPGGGSSVFEPSPVADNPSHIVPGGSQLLEPATDLHYNTHSFSDGEEASMSAPPKLSLDPLVKLKVEKLETALHYLGLDPTPEQQQELRGRVEVDSSGAVSYGDFVRAARSIFKQQLDERSFGPFMMEKSHLTHKSGLVCGKESISQILDERDVLRGELTKLQNALREKQKTCSLAEEELLRVRKEAQQTIIQNRSLQSKLHLVEQAQRASRGLEQDYEDVVRLLEAEVSEMKARENKVMDHPDVQQRIAILSCQLRKAELSKKTYEVATDKLLQFVESIHEVLTGQGDGFGFKDQVRGEPGRGPRPPGYLGKNKRHTPHTLAVEARDVAKTVQSLIEVEPLPFGWDEAYTEDGVKYYINHVTQVTSWVHPLSNVEHSSASRPVSSLGRPPPPMPQPKHVDITEPSP